MERRKEARIGELPVDRQGINLCHLSPPLMDDLGVLPGDVLMLVSLASSPRKALTRVGIRCAGIHDEEFQIDVDPEMMRYLGVKNRDSITVVSGHYLPSCFRINFEARTFRAAQNGSDMAPQMARLTDNEKKEYETIIKQARWAVYPGGIFAVNVNDEPVSFYVNPQNNLQLEPSLIETGTIVTIFDSEDQKKLEIKHQILIATNELVELENKISNLTRKIKGLKEDDLIIKKDIKGLAQQEEGFSKQRGLLEEELASIPAQALQQEEQLRDLQNQLAAIEKKYADAEAEADEVSFDIMADEENLNRTKEELVRLFAEL